MVEEPIEHGRDLALEKLLKGNRITVHQSPDSRDYNIEGTAEPTLEAHTAGRPETTGRLLSVVAGEGFEPPPTGLCERFRDTGDGEQVASGSQKQRVTKAECIGRRAQKGRNRARAPSISRQRRQKISGVLNRYAAHLRTLCPTPCCRSSEQRGRLVSTQG